MDYQPHPIDLTGITLDEKLQQDMEKIAQSIHEAWAAQRMREGWVYGETNDSEKKTHRCLVEYSRLPESEKDMDRITAAQTVKMLLWLGYEIKSGGE